MNHEKKRRFLSIRKTNSWTYHSSLRRVRQSHSCISLMRSFVAPINLSLENCIKKLINLNKSQGQLSKRAELEIRLANFQTPKNCKYLNKDNKNQIQAKSYLKTRRPSIASLIYRVTAHLKPKSGPKCCRRHTRAKLRNSSNKFRRATTLKGSWDKKSLSLDSLQRHA